MNTLQFKKIPRLKELMMIKIGRSILLGAEIETIYSVLKDAKRIPEWFAYIDNLETTDNFPEVGTVMDIAFKYGDVLLNYSMIVVEFVEGEYASFKLNGDLVGTQRWTTTPERGGYRLSIDYEYDLPVNGLSKFVERITRQTLAKSLANLKATVETDTVSAYF